MKNKKGSHVSFIISFVLFVSFLIFFIGIIKPFEKIETGKGALLKHLENEIIKETSAEVLVVSAKEGSGNTCLDIDSLSSDNAKTRQETGFIKFYFSDGFFTNNFQCDLTKNYEIGLVRSQKYILKSKVENLKYKYENNYENLKVEFGIPETNDFEFSFLGFDETLITTPKETPPTEVLAELIPVIYLDEDNVDIKNGYIKVILW